jgi:hypothetical protein
MTFEQNIAAAADPSERSDLILAEMARVLFGEDLNTLRPDTRAVANVARTLGDQALARINRRRATGAAHGL